MRTDRDKAEDAAVGWNEFVAAHPAAHYCHLHQWSVAFERAYKARSYHLVSESGGTIQGVLALTLLPGGIRPRRLFSLPYLDRGGLLAAGPAAKEDLVDQARELLAVLAAKGMEIRDWDVDREDEPRETARHRYVLALPPAREQLWNGLKGKVRNQVRKSEKEGLSTERSDSSKLSEFYSVFAGNMRDLGSPTHSLRFFREVLGLVPGAGLYLTSDREGRTVAGAVAIRFRDEVCVPWASAARSARASCPNHSLYWKILCDSVEGDADEGEGGAVSFDFGRSWQDSGPARFKLQWGAEPRPLYWCELSREGALRLVGTERPTSQSRLAALWQRLPLSIATPLGSRIRPYLAS